MSGRLLKPRRNNPIIDENAEVSACCHALTFIDDEDRERCKACFERCTTDGTLAEFKQRIETDDSTT